MKRVLTALAFFCFAASSHGAENLTPRPIQPPELEQSVVKSVAEEKQEIAECEKAGKEWAPADVTTNDPWQCKTKEDAEKIKQARAKLEAECKTKGGKWGTFDIYAIYECLMPYKDGGKQCHNSGECESKKCEAIFENGKQVSEHGACMKLPYRGDVAPILFDKK